MKTIREHLNSLPEPYRTEAFNNIIAQRNTGVLDLIENDIKLALLGSFEFNLSKEGLDYWFELYNSITEIIPIEHPAPPQSEPPIPNNRSDSDNEHKTLTVKKPTLTNLLFQMWTTTYLDNTKPIITPTYIFDDFTGI